MRLALLASLVWTFSASQAQATNYYVSPSGNNTTGTSYATAWTSFKNIGWSKFTHGDNLIVDGGPSGLVYNQMLMIPKGIQPGTHISPSVDAGHSGQVILDGQNTLAVGIDVNSPVTVTNSATGIDHGFLVRNFTGAGVKVEAQSGGGLIAGMEITGNRIGILVAPGLTSPAGSPLALNILKIHDNSIANVDAQSQCQLNADWIYSSNYAATGTRSIGALMNNPGIGASLSYLSISGGAPTARFPGSVNGCVFGPGLSYGLIAGANGQGLVATGCLFIDAQSANVLIQQPSATNTGGSSPGSYAFCDCTSFSTKKNANETGHYNFLDQRAAGASSIFIGNSVVYGGAVGIPAGQTNSVGYPNIQYAVTGNTTALATSQVNPQFNTNVAAIPDNASIPSLTGTSFAVSQQGPAASHGALVPSESVLQSAWSTEGIFLTPYSY